MRMKILSVMMLAGTVIGCASNPPPPQMVETSPAAPAPVTLGPVDGVFKGMATLPADALKTCAKLTKPQTVTVKKNAFVLGGLKASIGPDGAITAPTRKGVSLMGTASATALDLTRVVGKCTYHYVLAKS